MKQAGLSRLARDYVWIFLGSVLYAVSFDWFYVPNQLGFGGLTALGMILNHLSPAIPIGTVVLVLNIPLFLLGWKFLGWRTLVSSLFAMTATSLLVDLIAALYTFPPMDPMLAAIFGGVTLGVSLGMIFSKGATTGGTDLIARLLKLPFAWLPMGKLLLVVDLSMLLAVSVAFRSLNSALYGIISLYISTAVMDQVLYGLDRSKVAYIITSRPRPMAAEIDRQMDRGTTFLHGEGSFSKEEKLVLMCAFKQRQIVPLKALVHEMDPEAFLIVCDAHEVLGQGFRRYQKNDI
ncbi:YitT family protein [Pseudoflavonifractor sp. 60]|uniref:YitT family protein n=1 Tax=Pseudoflavonifractor sp. 60 TaxID=2304576 RepID=UPI001370C972|nr:YitT family protein [Pseudoflavonifractor sp. 60]NBI68581.1 YitT family protein [Pseudoflavonifractor sp. 60]